MASLDSLKRKATQVEAKEVVKAFSSRAFKIKKQNILSLEKLNLRIEKLK